MGSLEKQVVSLMEISVKNASHGGGEQIYKDGLSCWETQAQKQSLFLQLNHNLTHGWASRNDEIAGERAKSPFQDNDKFNISAPWNRMSSLSLGS